MISIKTIDQLSSQILCGFFIFIFILLESFPFFQLALVLKLFFRLRVLASLLA